MKEFSKLVIKHIEDINQFYNQQFNHSLII